MAVRLTIHYDNLAGLARPHLRLWHAGGNPLDLAPTGGDEFGPLWELSLVRPELSFTFTASPGAAQTDGYDRRVRPRVRADGGLEPGQVWCRGDRAFVYAVRPADPSPNRPWCSWSGWPSGTAAQRGRRRLARQPRPARLLPVVPPAGPPAPPLPGPAPGGFDPAAAGQFEWILGPWLDESHGGGRRTVGWRAHPSDRATDTLAVLLNFEGFDVQVDLELGRPGVWVKLADIDRVNDLPPDGTNDPRDPTALHSTDGRFASFTLPSSSGFIYKWTAP